MFKRFLVFTLPVILAGCLSFGFKAQRKSEFTDIDNNSIFVEYGTEERSEVLPNGASLNFKRKVRITLPDGKRVILYQTISTSGVRYHTPDNKYMFIERGPWCQFIKDGAIVYKGMFRNNCPL